MDHLKETLPYPYHWILDETDFISKQIDGIEKLKDFVIEQRDFKRAIELRDWAIKLRKRLIELFEIYQNNKYWKIKVSGKDVKGWSFSVKVEN